ncbi:MAG: hypothetical protein ACOC5D_00360 [Thermoplasmatota archaeon]
MGRRIITIILTLLFVLSLPLCDSIEADKISSPSNVNQILSDFSDIDMSPGEDSQFSFDFYNPYDSSMKNISLDIEIYRFRDFNENDGIDDLEDSISFEESDDLGVVFETEELDSRKELRISYRVVSNEKTEKGVYSLRFKLTLELDERKVSMKSIGYFTNQQLNKASNSVGENDEEHFVGGYNITELGVDGILKETSMTIKDSNSVWPQYVLVATTIVFSILAVYFYTKENKT